MNNEVGSRGLGPSIASIDESASRIRDAVEMSEELANQIHGQLDRLEKRLDTVLTPNAPTPAMPGDTKSPQPVNSHLAARLYTQNVVLQNVIDRLSRLAQRVEV